MNERIFKKIIYLIVIVLVAVLCYKVYLVLHEEDYRSSNFNNIQKIDSLSEKDDYAFAVLGSAENSIDIFQNKIIPDINNDGDILFMISTGNSVLDGVEDKYRILHRMLGKMKVPYIIGVGTSEIADGGNMNFYKHFGPFYNSFVYGNSYFIFIDTTGTTSYALQENWVENELTQGEQYAHTFVFMDRSPLYQYLSGEDNGLSFIKKDDFSDFLVTAFSDHNVEGVFTNGADYRCDVVDGVSYYASGGAGGLLLDNTGENDFHYLKVNVNQDGILVNVVKESSSFNSLVNQLENVWFYIHSIFYAQFVNMLIGLCLLLLIVLFLYKKASKNVDYYRDFTFNDDALEVPDRLHIAMFTNNYLPFVGGVPISIYRLSEALRSRGNQITVFAPEYPGDSDTDHQVIRCQLLHYRKTGNFNFAIANIFSKRIDRAFNGRSFDVVHVHHPFWLGKKGLKLGLKKRIPVVLTYHTRLELYSENLPFGKTVFKKFISHKMIKTFAQKCDGVVAPTVSAAEYLANIGVSRDKLVLPTGIDLKPYQDADASAVNHLRNDYVNADEVLLCSVSRLSVEKNIDFLIRGLQYVKEHCAVKFKCLLIGTGPERDHLQQLVDELDLHQEIILIGSVPQTEIVKYYLASDLFVFSSLSETQGMVLLEAMAGKCPVVCIRSSGTDDVVRDSFNGFKTAKSREEWAGKIIGLLENKDKLNEMSANAFGFAQEFTVEKMAEKAEAFYKKLIVQKRAMKR